MSSEKANSDNAQPVIRNPQPATRNHNYLAFDHGAVRIGVAVGNAVTGTAQPLDPIDGRDRASLDAAVRNLLATWSPARLIVGLPLSMGGEQTGSTEAAKRFAERLSELSALPVELHDERLTSREAAARFRDARRGGRASRKHGRKLDSIAAALILESWFNEGET